MVTKERDPEGSKGERDPEEGSVLPEPVTPEPEVNDEPAPRPESMEDEEDDDEEDP